MTIRHEPRQRMVLPLFCAGSHTRPSDAAALRLRSASSRWSFQFGPLGVGHLQDDTSGLPLIVSTPSPLLVARDRAGDGSDVGVLVSQADSDLLHDLVDLRRVALTLSWATCADSPRRSICGPGAVVGASCTHDSGRGAGCAVAPLVEGVSKQLYDLPPARFRSRSDRCWRSVRPASASLTPTVIAWQAARDWVILHDQ